MLHEIVVSVVFTILLSNQLGLSSSQEEPVQQHVDESIDQFLKRVRQDISVDISDYTNGDGRLPNLGIEITKIPERVQETLQDYSNRYNRRTRREDNPMDNGKKMMPDMCCGKMPLKPPNMADIKKCESTLRNMFESRPKGSAYEDDFKMDNVTILKIQGCMTECMFKAKGVLDANGNMQKDNFFKTFKNMFDADDQDWRVEVIKDAYDNCVKQAKDQSQIYIDQINCNLIPFGVHRCLYRYFETHCPNDKMIQTPVCEDIRKNMANEEEIFVFYDME